MVDELGVYYDAAAVAGRLRQARQAVVWRLAVPVVLAVVVCVLWVVFPASANAFGPWSLAVLGFYAVIGVIRDLLRLHAVRIDTTQVVGSLALGLNREGTLVGQTWLPWADVATMWLRPGRFGGSDRLVIQARDDRSVWLPLAYTDAVPGWLDSVVRALSGGRVGVDWSRLDV